MIQSLTSAEIRNSFDTDSSVRILCSYSNVTHHIQIIRLKSSCSLPWERVVFPGQRLMFEATPEAKLEIHTSETKSVIVPCHQLRVTERKYGIKLPN